MKVSKKQLTLYLVTSRKWLNGKSFVNAIEEAIIGGVTMVQLREKNLPDDKFLELAYLIKDVCHKYQVPFIINDNLDVALKVDSDGIHIGQDDLPVDYVRKKIGESKILGVTAHNLNEALTAKKLGADYLGVGALFATTTKDNTIPLTINDLKEITRNVDIPVVAIGGIDENNCLQLTNCNLAGIAVVSAIMNNDDIKAATRKLKQKAQLL